MRVLVNEKRNETEAAPTIITNLPILARACDRTATSGSFVSSSFVNQVSGKHSSTVSKSGVAHYIQIMSLTSRDEMGGNFNHFEAKALLYRVANVTKWHPRNVATRN